MVNQRTASSSVRWGRVAAFLPFLAIPVGLSAYQALGFSETSAAEAPAADYAGITKVAMTEHYIVVVNVLPAEEMFTKEQFEKEHPTVGELVVHGHTTPTPPLSRHTEAHIYSQETGLALTDIDPRLTLIDHTSGKIQDVDATLMQDVVVGPSDLHFGSNLVIEPDHEFTIVVTIGSEEVSVDGMVR